ncbi:DNA polymerase III subunit beta [Patescibacteria group bacterium]|nr:DNA polymerase III subunit beta [Patescibacteria group bacterium]MBU4162047.1 DNA polymerase III subunit beta [Patescibacteria group bacterium]
MKIIILKEKLAKGLSMVEKITGRNFTLPILNNVLISAEDNSLKLSTTDLELGISYWGLAKVEEKGEITIPVKTLSSFVSLIGEEKVTIESKEKTLYLKGENYKTQIKGLEAKDFPIIPEVVSDKWIEFDATTFCKGIMLVMDFCALTQVRPELSGLYFVFQKNSAKIVATDSFRLAEKSIALDGATQGIDGPQSFILPRNAARELVNIFSEHNGKIKFYLSPSQIMVESYVDETKNPQARLVSRLIEGEYPDYEAVIPKEFKTRLTLSREEFSNQIKIASLFSGRTNEVKLEISPKKGNVLISSQSVDLGETESKMAIDASGDDVEISFNYKFLSEGLNQIKSEKIVLELNGQDGPGVLKSSDDSTYIYVIMPIKAS